MTENLKSNLRKSYGESTACITGHTKFEFDCICCKVALRNLLRLDK